MVVTIRWIYRIVLDDGFHWANANKNHMFAVSCIFTWTYFFLMQVYYTYYGTVSSGVSSVPVGNTTARMFVVGNLQQNVVYVFEVSLGLTGRHSYPVYSKSKSGM